MTRTKKVQDIVIMGFALFAIFFGAGNLIFPPYIGVVAGKQWYEVMFGFLMTDPVLPILGVIVTATVGGKADDMGKRVGPVFSKVLCAMAILIIGPLFAVPRTAATTHEIATQQLFPGIPPVVTSAVFFAITAFLVFNPGGAIDKIGKYLTPGLLIALTAIIVTCIVKPIGKIQEMPAQNFFLRGFTEGYQTMDAVGSSLLAGIVMSDIVRRGYKNSKEQFRIMVGVGIVAFLLLSFVYGGLTYVGATAGEYFTPETSRVDILVGVVYHLFGSVGKLCIGLVVALACLTTSVGLTATCGNFFEEISQGRLKYKYIVLTSITISLFLSLKGVEGLINLAIPVLLAIYPIFIVLTLMTLFDRHIKYDWTYTGAVIGTLAVSIIPSLNMAFGILGSLSDAVQNLPLAAIGFNWFVPAALCSIVLTVFSAFSGMGGRREPKGSM
ncbi:branched-chain amino acid transport system II carrier protein [Filifactor villosus]|uniref:Branched-chain amino acid transport system carrier protein n=1 Tax=Filifactor villosus TaxID=29374 RepID=A0ABV9QM17_9FIRM